MCDCVPIKLYQRAWEIEFHVIFLGHKIFLKLFFNHLGKENPLNLCTIKRIKEDNLGDTHKLYLTLHELSNSILKAPESCNMGWEAEASAE